MRGFCALTLTTIVVALSLVACGDDRPSLDLPKGSRVLFIGDSITFHSTDAIRFVVTGAGLKPDIYAVGGAAINGAPLVNWPQKITQLVAKDHPDAVVVELGEHPLHDVVLLHALEGDVLDVGHGRAGHGIEDLLLDSGVLRELFDDAVDDVALLHVGVVAGLLEPLEQILDLAVVVLEQGDRVHGRAPTQVHVG